MCITKECPDPTQVGVWWRDDAEWRLYDRLSAQAILFALIQGIDMVELSGLFCGASYKVHLGNMQQINKASGHIRAVKVVLPSDIATFSYHPLGTSVSSFGFLFSLIDRIRDEERVLRKLGPIISPHVVANHKGNASISIGFRPYMELEMILKEWLTKSSNLLEDVQNVMQAGDEESNSVMNFTFRKASKPNHMQSILDGTEQTTDLVSVVQQSGKAQPFAECGRLHESFVPGAIYSFVVFLVLSVPTIASKVVNEPARCGAALPIMAVDLVYKKMDSCMY